MLRVTYENKIGISTKLLKEEKIEVDSLDSIPSPSTTVKIQIIGEKVYLRE